MRALFKLDVKKGEGEEAKGGHPSREMGDEKGDIDGRRWIGSEVEKVLCRGGKEGKKGFCKEREEKINRAGKEQKTKDQPDAKGVKKIIEKAEERECREVCEEDRKDRGVDGKGKGEGAFQKRGEEIDVLGKRGKGLFFFARPFR